MKKSKILIPAVAVLALSVGASVTGTVAWFTTNRTATITASKFASVKLGENLKAVVTGNSDAGTVKTADNAIKIGTTDYEAKLTHGSYAATADIKGSAYVANLNDENTVTSYNDLGTYASHVSGETTKVNKWKAQSKTDSVDEAWYAVGWTIDFSQKAASDTEKNYLLVDTKGTTFSDSVTGGHTINGLRIALMTGSKFLVLGGDDTVTYVSSTSATDKYTAGTNYVNVVSDTASSKLNDNDATVATSYLSLGELPSNGTDKLTVTCVAWFEGTDNYVADKYNETTIVMSSVTAALSFYSRKIA